MKKLKYGLLLGLGIVLLSGCNSFARGNIDEKRWIDNASCEIFEVTDPQTGVHYLFFDSGYGGGVTVMYNADGTIKADK